MNIREHSVNHHTCQERTQQDAQRTPTNHYTQVRQSRGAGRRDSRYLAAGSLGAGRGALRHDLDADEVGSRELTRRLALQHRIERRDRYRQLVEIGLAGGEQL
jgi:hypothetical protein